ncbi:22775_t:CDS:2 [Dentiscutata erythropus]|uniref:22775_t:CDS:1 n=1 Tax=Dentiscutata erythropus TaxID=1348616 RepID=A0A9N9IFM5_9GLOM|nr:22775_t:CDS:2 [Dentiscutata erythropus]
MTTDQKHSSDSAPSEQDASRRIEKIIQLFGQDEQNAGAYRALSGEIRALEKKIEDYYSWHKNLKKEVNRLEKYIEKRIDWLKDDVGELLAMRHCNCSKESINSSSECSSSESSSSESSSSEETITIVEEFEESDSDYTLCKGSIGPKKKIHKVNSGKDLKKYCSINNIWKDEVIREIRRRLIVDCTFTCAKISVKALIVSKSKHNSISKSLAKKIDLYISREFGSRYPAVVELGINTTNAGKKVMVRGWVHRENVSVSLPNIFDGLKPPSYLGTDTATFVVVDKPEYDLVLEKRLYYVRNDIDILSPSLYTFYELVFPSFTEINSDGEVIITKFKREFDGLSEYYDSDYTETESSNDSSDIETESGDEVTYNNNLPPPMIMDSPDSPNNFISTFSDFLKQNGGANNNFISAFLNQELAQYSLAEQWYSTDLTNPTLWNDNVVMEKGPDRPSDMYYYPSSKNADMEIENPTTSEMVFVKIHDKIVQAEKILEEKTREVSCAEYEVLDSYYLLGEVLVKKLAEFETNHPLQTARTLLNQEIKRQFPSDMSRNVFNKKKRSAMNIYKIFSTEGLGRDNIKRIRNFKPSTFGRFSDKIMKVIQERVRTTFFKSNGLEDQLENLDLDEGREPMLTD